MTTRLGIHVSPTITSDATTLHVCKQQQIVSGNKLFFSDTLDSNWLIVVSMTIRLCTHVPSIITSDPATLHVCKQQITSDNKLLLVIH